MSFSHSHIIFGITLTKKSKRDEIFSEQKAMRHKTEEQNVEIKKRERERERERKEKLITRRIQASEIKEDLAWKACTFDRGWRAGPRPQWHATRIVIYNFSVHTDPPVLTPFLLPLPFLFPFAAPSSSPLLVVISLDPPFSQIPALNHANHIIFLSCNTSSFHANL